MTTNEGRRSIAHEEIQAIERSLPEVGRFVAGIENDRPLSAWDKDEILRLILTTVQSYQKNMDEITTASGPPF